MTKLTTTLKQRKAAFQLLQAEERRSRPTPQQRAKAKRDALPSYESFVEQQARSAAKFFDAEEWASLLRHRKHMTPKGREKLVAAFERLIREAEKMIDELTK
jgi:hypothetical protein